MNNRSSQFGQAAKLGQDRRALVMKDFFAAFTDKLMMIHGEVVSRYAPLTENQRPRHMLEGFKIDFQFGDTLSWIDRETLDSQMCDLIWKYLGEFTKWSGAPYTTRKVTTTYGGFLWQRKPKGVRVQVWFDRFYELDMTP